jgi:hypothetical protein
MPLKATFLRSEGERDRIYVTRSDGSEVGWAFPTYGAGLPHDLVHLVVETVFSLSRGFWGKVDEGADPGRISDEANRKGGADKYAAFGPDQADLQRAEILAGARWSEVTVAADVEVAVKEAGLGPFSAVSPERVLETRRALEVLQRRWAQLLPKGSLSLTFDRDSPRAGISLFGL